MLEASLAAVDTKNKIGTKAYLDDTVRDNHDENALQNPGFSND